MTAWEVLTSGSTLPSGTAWAHLNAQGGVCDAGPLAGVNAVQYNACMTGVIRQNGGLLSMWRQRQIRHEQRRVNVLCEQRQENA